MATPLTDAINALTTYANEVTGESDTNLSDAVYSLAEGYGQGVSVPLLESYEAITIEQDLLSYTTNNFKNDYLPDMNRPPYKTIVYLIENTYADAQYAAQAACRLSALSNDYANATTRLYIRSSGPVNAGNNYFYIGAGSVLHKFVFSASAGQP